MLLFHQRGCYICFSRMREPHEDMKSKTHVRTGSNFPGATYSRNSKISFLKSIRNSKQNKNHIKKSGIVRESKRKCFRIKSEANWVERRVSEANFHSMTFLFFSPIGASQFRFAFDHSFSGTPSIRLCHLKTKPPASLRSGVLAHNYFFNAKMIQKA